MPLIWIVKTSQLYWVKCLSRTAIVCERIEHIVGKGHLALTPSIYKEWII